MRKTMKKMAAILLAGALAAAIAVPVMAANTITIDQSASTDKTDHTYEAYQIFDGDYDAASDQLQHIQWGSGITAQGQAALAKALGIDTSKSYTAADVAGALADKQYTFDAQDLQDLADTISKYLGTAAGTSAKGGNTITVNDDGYYFIKDKDGSVEGTDSAYTRFILQVVNNVTVTPKSDIPTFEKKVDDKNDSTGAEDAIVWQDSADYDIGDTIPYKLTGTLPNNYDKYENYDYIFTDTMTHLTFVDDATFKVVVDNSGNETDITSHFDKAWDASAKKLTVTAKDTNGLKDISGIDKNSKIIVYYTATLDSDANIGKTGNPNTAYLTYSNNPNQGGTGDTADTKTDKNIIFTYQTIINKVDEDNNALAGAEFAIYKVKATPASSGTEGTAVGSFVKVGTSYYEIIAVETVTKDTTGTIFTTKGIDDGTYVLVETTTPSGYNTIAPQVFTVTATHDTDKDEPELLTLSGSAETGSVISFTASVDAGSLTSTVVNQSGSTLPSTGGMGTTIFYIIGGLLVLGAVIILVSRKKVQA